MKFVERLTKHLPRHDGPKWHTQETHFSSKQTKEELNKDDLYAIMCICAVKALVTVTYSIFSPFLGNPPRLPANKLTTLTLEMMNAVSCEGLQCY